MAIQWCPNEHGGIWNHWHLSCLLIHLFRHISKKISKFHVTGLCEGNPLVTDEFPSQRASNLKMFPFDDVIMNSFCFYWFKLLHPQQRNQCTMLIVGSFISIFDKSLPRWNIFHHLHWECDKSKEFPIILGDLWQHICILAKPTLRIGHGYLIASIYWYCDGITYPFPNWCWKMTRISNYINTNIYVITHPC